jgi:hypothetical protein
VEGRHNNLKHHHRTHRTHSRPHGVGAGAGGGEARAAAGKASPRWALVRKAVLGEWRLWLAWEGGVTCCTCLCVAHVVLWAFAPAWIVALDKALVSLTCALPVFPLDRGAGPALPPQRERGA